MSTPKDYSSLKYIISQPSKDKQSSFSLPKDYSSHHKNRLFAEKRNLSTCELITNVSNENDLGDEEIYLDQEDINILNNGRSIVEYNEADLSDGSDDSSLISVPATISLLERLIRTHPIWLLTNLERENVVKLLCNKEPGTFIVRNSSKPNTMALSVRLPKGKGPYIEHYLIENLGNRKLHLEGSDKYFSVIPMLICHYCQCLDELPICLKLPDILLNASRHQLNSLSLLSENFWTTSNFDEQIYSLSETDEAMHLNKNQFQEKSVTNEQINNDHSKDGSNHNSNHHISSLNRSLDRLSIDEDKRSIETKELVFETDDDEDIDHNFIKKEVFSSESCDNAETEVKRHCFMDDQDDEIKDDQIENELDKLVNLKVIDKQMKDLNEFEEKVQKESKNDDQSIPLPPRKNIAQPLRISPPPLPARNLKPVVKQYFKLSSLAPETTTPTKSNKQNEELTSNKKKSVASNLNLLIDFDVLEEEEKLIEQLKENDIFNLNVINAQTQQMMSSQISTQLNGDSGNEFSNSTDLNKPLLNDQMNVTKIEINTGGGCKTIDEANDKIQEKLDELNQIEMKLNQSKEELELKSANLNDEQSNEKNKIESTLILPSSSVQSTDFEPLIGQQSSFIQPLISEKISENNHSDQLNNYEDIWRQPDVKPKKQRPKVETKNCEVQTDVQSILDDLKLKRYQNFLVYDYPQNVKMNNQLSKDLMMFVDPIYSTNEEKELLFYQHLLKRNLSNPNLNQLTNNSQSTKNTESHSFESLYVTFDSVNSKQNHFFERYIVPRDSNLSDVCLQVGDGHLMKTASRKNSIRTELINEERVKLVDKKKQLKDDNWTVDCSWEFCSSEDEQLTHSIVNDENISSRYRKYTSKYIIESGVESDSDGELNETGLQSIINDNVQLKGFDMNGIGGVKMNVKENKVKRSNQVTKQNLKTNSPLMLIDNEEPCSSGFFETTNNQNNKIQTNELKQSINVDSQISNSIAQQQQQQQTNKQNSINTSLRQQRNEDTEDEMVFQEIGLDDIYTTNDELDENDQLVDELEDIYTVTAPNVTYSTVAKSISEYIFELYRLNDNVFAKSINNFILCSKETYETNPMIIMRNIRQFMNGMKNYLIKNGEKEFLDFVKHERKRLKPEEFLNLEAIITACLHKLIIKPLKEFIYQKFVAMEFRFGYESYMKLNENISFLSTRLPEEFGIQNNVRLPNNKTMKRIAIFFSKLQTYSPLKKLEYLLSIVSIVNFHTKIIDKQAIDGKMNKQRIDEQTFVSVIIYLLVKFNVVNIEIEIDYVWSLLQPNLINGDAGYFLNLLSSCVYVLKSNFTICPESNYPLNIIELQRSMITSYLSSLNDSLNAKCKLGLFQKEITNNLVLPKVIDHPELMKKNLKHSKKRNHTFNQNINELTLVNSNFVQSSYPSALNNCRQDSFFRTNILQNNNQPLKLNSLFTICCLKILILDEFLGNINCKLIVIRPEMSSKEFCRLIAQKFSIFNNSDYSLFILTQEGREFQIDDHELPFSIKINAIKYGINLSFVFKRIDSEFVFSNKFYELNHFESFGLI